MPTPPPLMTTTTTMMMRNRTSAVPSSTSSFSSSSLSLTSFAAREDDDDDDENKNKNDEDDDEDVDWRELFRSRDYDDPWSPRLPLPPTTGSTSTSTSTVAPSSVLDGTWTRRRHGMNLEPLTCAVVVFSGGGGAKESRDGNATAATTNADATDKMTVTATIEDVKARALCIDVQTH